MAVAVMAVAVITIVLALDGQHPAALTAPAVSPLSIPNTQGLEAGARRFTLHRDRKSRPAQTISKMLEVAVRQGNEPAEVVGRGPIGPVPQPVTADDALAPALDRTEDPTGAM